jgi:hypothetical protein
MHGIAVPRRPILLAALIERVSASQPCGIARHHGIVEPVCAYRAKITHDGRVRSIPAALKPMRQGVLRYYRNRRLQPANQANLFNRRPGTSTQAWL